MSLEHICNHAQCNQEVTECFCEKHFDQIQGDSYDDGYNDKEKELNKLS